jgi:hypothetical protein
MQKQETEKRGFANNPIVKAIGLQRIVVVLAVILEALLFSILKIQNNFIARVSHPEPGMSARQYYKDLREKFVAAVSEKADQVHNL